MNNLGTQLKEYWAIPDLVEDTINDRNSISYYGDDFQLIFISDQVKYNYSIISYLYPSGGLIYQEVSWEKQNGHS